MLATCRPEEPCAQHKHGSVRGARGNEGAYLLDLSRPQACRHAPEVGGFSQLYNSVPSTRALVCPAGGTTAPARLADFGRPLMLNS